MMKNGDMPAIGHAGRIDEDGFACAPGLTKRELFAAMKRDPNKYRDEAVNQYRSDQE